MNVSKVVCAAAVRRTPLISFLGKRVIPLVMDRTPRAHPQSPSSVLPQSFAEYRKNAQQHGPLSIHAAPAKGSIEPAAGEYFDRNQLPKRFWRVPMTKEEIELIESGGAAAWA